MKELLKSVKSGVERAYGSSICYAKDCQSLGDDITQKTGRQISISTLKRFFGIISSPFNPSAYTLDTLVHYLGFENWRDYVNSYQVEKHNYGDSSWQKIAERVDIVTESSLENIKSKIGFNYNSLIERNSLLHTYDRFYKSDDNLLVLVAPDGYGKTTAIVQFYNWLNCSENNGPNNDICCIIEGSMFYYKVSDYKDNELLKQLVEFNLGKSLNEYFRTHEDQIEGQFIIIIDDVDEVFLDKERYHLFVGNLMHILQAYLHMPWFKLILTCRPENLKPFDYFLKKNPVLLEKCNGAFKMNSDRINIPLFSDIELNQLIKKRNSNIDLNYLKFYYSDLLSLIRYPFFIDVILDAIEEKSDVSEIEIVSQSLVRKLYEGPYGEEKYALIESFLNLCQLGHDTTVVPKNDLLKSSSSTIAYNDLVASGMLCEKVVYDKFLQKQSYVEFTQKLILEYLVAINWVKSYELNLELFKAVGDYYLDNKALKCGVLNWLVKLVFDSDDIDLIKDLHRFAEIESFELNGDFKIPCYGRVMASAVSVTLRKNKSYREKLLPFFASSKLGQYLYYDQYFDIDAIMFYDTVFMDEYLKHSKNDKSRISALFLKFMHGYFDNDTISCNDAYTLLSQMEAPTIDNIGLLFRYYAVVILYKDRYEKEFPHEDLDEVIRMINSKVDKSNLVKIYVRLLFLLFFTSEPNAIIEVYDQLDKMSNWSKLSSSRYLKVIQMIYADALVSNGKTSLATEIYNKAVLLDSSDVKSLFVQMCQIASELEVELSLGVTDEKDVLLKELYQISKLLNNRYFVDKLHHFNLSEVE